MALPVRVIGDEFSNWTWRNPVPVGASFLGITYADNLFVAAGHAGNIVTSTNGREWRVETSGTIKRFWGVMHGADRFVAFGEAANLVSSPDGHAWTVETPNFSQGVRALCFGAGTWAMLDEYGNIRSASHLDWWELRVPAVQAAFADMIFAQDLFVAVGSRGSILTSTNATDWIPQNSGTTAALADIAYGNGRFVAVGNSDETAGHGLILTSSDGTNWFLQFTDFPLYGVAYGPGGFTAVGGNFGSCGQSLNSSDGTYFTAGPAGCDSGLPDTPYDVACNEEFCVAAGINGLLAISEDGLIWESVQQGTVATLLTAAATEQLLVVAGGSGVVLTSGDGHSFTNHVISGIWRAVATDGSGFVLVGDDGAIAESPSGIQWLAANSPVVADLNAVTHGPSGWVVGGANGIILNRNESGQWDGPATSLGKTVRHLTFSRGLNQYVASGHEGLLAFSSTGRDWVRSDLPATEYLSGFAEGADRFVVLSQRRAFISTDGLNWTSVELGTKNTSYLAWANGAFVAAGNLPNNLLVSEDGYSWTIRPVGAQSINALTYFKSTFIAASYGGLVMQSASAATPRIEGISLGPIDMIDLRVSGEIGQNYELLSSTNLIDWQIEQDYTLSARQDSLILPSSREKSFYRAKLK
jgi:hypothetical protein